MTSSPFDLDSLLTAQSLIQDGKTGQATFTVAPQEIPQHWSFFVSGGASNLVRHLTQARFSREDLGFLAAHGLLDPAFLERLKSFRFTGDVLAVPEGELFFPGEPFLEITCPLFEGVILRALVLSLVGPPCLIASRAARCVLASQQKTLLDATGVNDSIKAKSERARATYLVGFSGTSNLQAAKDLAIPFAGVPDPLFMDAYPDLEDAYRHMVTSFEETCFLPLGPKDKNALSLAIQIGTELARKDQILPGIAVSPRQASEFGALVRTRLDAAGLAHTKILVQGDLDEFGIQDLLDQKIPVDGFSLVVSPPRPSSQAFCYELVELSGMVVNPTTSGPGKKQIYRIGDAQARPRHDIVSTRDPMKGYGPKAWPVLTQIMKNGIPVPSEEDLDSRRKHCRHVLRVLRQDVSRIRNPESFQVRLSPELD